MPNPWFEQGRGQRRPQHHAQSPAGVLIGRNIDVGNAKIPHRTQQQAGSDHQYDSARIKDRLLMDKIKTILIVLAIIFCSLGVLATIGFLYSLLQLVLLVGVAGLAGYIGFRLWSSKSQGQIDSSRPERQLHTVERTLQEYKRKLK